MAAELRVRTWKLESGFEAGIGLSREGLLLPLDCVNWRCHRTGLSISRFRHETGQLVIGLGQGEVREAVGISRRQDSAASGSNGDGCARPWRERGGGEGERHHLIDLHPRHWGPAALFGIGHIRRPGCRRRPTTESQPGMEAVLKALARPAVRGDSVTTLAWESWSCRSLAAELAMLRFEVSHGLVAKMLKGHGFTK